MQLCVIDIGGTSIKYGVVDSQGTLIYHHSVPTDASKGGKALVEKILLICNNVIEDHNILGIAISSAGIINNKTGRIVYVSDTIPGYTGTPLAELVSNSTGLPVTVDNDVNCTALGEYWKGAAKGVKDFLCITIGTGIGGALFLNGQLYRGTNFSAGEIGHMNLYPNGKKCTCGNNGCYERYASSSALSERIEKEMGTSIALPTFFEIVKRGERDAEVIFKKWVEDLTTGLQSLVHIFNPELLVIGGGISAQGDFLIKAISDSLTKKIMPNHKQSLQIKHAMNNNNANLLGAAKCFLDRSRGINGNL